MGLGKQGRLPDATRAAIMAALLEGQGVTFVAGQYNVNRQTVARLKTKISAEQWNAVTAQKELDIATMISENLQISFAAMRNILQLTNDRSWITKQPAAELATLFGVTSDKVFRVLQAIENANKSEE